ncbi:MAG: hypothetical protein HDR01_03940 [Lachnospiraceae bacterium]|nr:hypothetical protein [Lachnospiraceae bacterium]
MGKKSKMIVCFLLFLLFLWMAAGAVDLSRVNRQKSPVFSMETENQQYCHYSGLGYSFDIVQNPFSGTVQYAFYLFGMEVKNNFTNKVPPFQYLPAFL